MEANKEVLIGSEREPVLDRWSQVVRDMALVYMMETRRWRGVGVRWTEVHGERCGFAVDKRVPMPLMAVCDWLIWARLTTCIAQCQGMLTKATWVPMPGAFTSPVFHGFPEPLSSNHRL